MPAKDLYHQSVKNALVKDGWIITADPFEVRFLDVRMVIDLAADRIIAAIKGHEKIAVEIKSFLGSSALSDFHAAVGQFLDYRVALEHSEPERGLFLAVPLETYNTFFQSQFGQFAIEHYQLRLIVYSIKQEEIIQWLP